MTSRARRVQPSRFPSRGSLKSVNVHLVELDEGFMLIDSGVATEECFEVARIGAARNAASSGPISARCC